MQFGHPEYPETKTGKYVRIEAGIEKITERHFGEEQGMPVVILVTHAFGIIGFAKVFKDKEYDGNWAYGCISACRVFKNGESEVVLSSY